MKLHYSVPREVEVDDNDSSICSLQCCGLEFINCVNMSNGKKNYFRCLMYNIGLSELNRCDSCLRDFK